MEEHESKDHTGDYMHVEATIVHLRFRNDGKATNVTVFSYTRLQKLTHVRANFHSLIHSIFCKQVNKYLVDRQAI